MDNPDDNPQLDIVAQRWAPVTLREASDVLASLAEPLKAKAILANSGRPTAAGALIDTDRGPVYLKRYARSVREAATILPYHRFAAHLASHGISTPPFLPFAGGREGAEATVLTRGEAVYEVGLRAEGEDRYITALTWDPPASLAEAEALGGFVARMALAAEGFDEPQPAPDTFQNRFDLFAAEDFPAALDRWLGERPAIKCYLADTGRDMLSDLKPMIGYVERVAAPWRTLAPQWTHGDPHISNFMWSGDHPVSVFDFGLACRNAAIFDLVMLIERHAIQWVDVMDGHEGACRPDVAAALIRGWARVRPLGEAERALVPDMLPICQGESALNWIGYYMLGTKRTDDAAWCYDTALLGHGLWFGSQTGRDFLASVRRALDS